MWLLRVECFSVLIPFLAISIVAPVQDNSAGIEAMSNSNTRFDASLTTLSDWIKA